MNAGALRAALVKDEGNKRFPYVDTVGKTSIGIGHNLTDRGLSAKIIDAIYEDDVAECINDLIGNFAWFSKLDWVRQNVLLNMRFQLGPSRFRGFKNMLSALARSDYAAAAVAMADSAWATQVPNRANRLIVEMEHGAVES